MSSREAGEQLISWFKGVWDKANSGFLPDTSHALQATVFIQQIQHGDHDPEEYGGDCINGICSLASYGLSTIMPMSSRLDFTPEKEELVTILEHIDTNREEVRKTLTLMNH